MKNYKTTLGTIFTAIGLIPQAIQFINIAEVPTWIKTTGLVCAFISFIYTGVNAKDRDVTGAGDNAKRIN